MRYTMHRILERLVAWWRNRIAVYYNYQPSYGTLQQQLDRLVVPDRCAWRCRPRLVARDISHAGSLSIPSGVDLILVHGTIFGDVTINGDSSLQGWSCEFAGNLTEG